MRLLKVQELLDLFRSDGWSYFAESVLGEDERIALNKLVEAEDPASRERVRYIRHLLSLKDIYEAEEARLSAQLAALEEEA